MAAIDPGTVQVAVKAYSRSWDRSDPYAMMAYAPAACTLADAYLAEHDDSPLTLEKLVELGGEPDPEWPGDYRFPGVNLRVVAIAKDSVFWNWCRGLGRPVDIDPKPYTVGDLLYLLRRLERK